MTTAQQAHLVRNFGAPDEVRQFAAHGHSDVVDLDGRTVTLSRFEPGWRWSVDVAPIAGTSSCQSEHLGYCVSGRMRIRQDDGMTFEVAPGEVVHIRPGHDGETVGDEPAIFLDFGDVATYARRQS